MCEIKYFIHGHQNYKEYNDNIFILGHKYKIWQKFKSTRISLNISLR